MTPPVPVTVPPAAAPAALGRGEYERLARRVKLLSWLSLGWMTAEGAIAITAGIVAGRVGIGLSGDDHGECCC